MKYIKHSNVYIGLIFASLGLLVLMYSLNQRNIASQIEIEGQIQTQDQDDFEQNIQTEVTDIEPEIPVVFDAKLLERVQEQNVHTITTTWQIGDEVYEIKITPEESVYDAMIQAKEENIFSFEGKNYPMLGFFVTRIGSLEMSRGKSLMYYVNDIEASVGVSNYILKEGDSIEWRLN